jgi:hypothetical protein
MLAQPIAQHTLHPRPLLRGGATTAINHRRVTPGQSLQKLEQRGK